MSLLDAYGDECQLLEKTRQPDGQGGYTVAWMDGVKFTAAWEYESSPQVIIAEQQGVNRVYRIYVDKSLGLDYHDVIKRLSDGTTFRVTNPGTDRHTPASSGLNKRLIEIEKWELPHEFEEEEPVNAGGNAGGNG